MFKKKIISCCDDFHAFFLIYLSEITNTNIVNKFIESTLLLLSCFLFHFLTS
jgi:hypothetical protein